MEETQKTWRNVTVENTKCNAILSERLGEMIANTEFIGKNDWEMLGRK